ncbi:hypothetical protein CONCODRAFT_73826 [Conidiobolus coronatus NRRL 28638]|uniref:Uncharacterized protein n=1 Tax=Conidiobolus coronatus (strain ATCC 28846 / CBS 209.66 / NRRL 28638) TaxID=796925 RepID=A0A137NU32_CONC2|nr:hypothetical protein CONCODRAFT_73826 [Conidiobolus coronatus NRRL 28638]|eukprot:KXN66201.1 hypothetical protein CONCODRAFT_73826 [Conidiobolus coronatus NRRL 28638]
MTQSITIASPTLKVRLLKVKKLISKMPRTELPKSDYSDSAYSSISNFSDLITSNQQASYMQDSLNYGSNQSTANNPLSIDRHKYMTQSLVQHQQPQSFKNLNAPKFDTNICSLSQLIGRKNPPVTKHNTISLTIPDEYKARDLCDENPGSGFSLSNSSQYDADSTYSQHTSQKPYNFENIDLYVHQIVSSIRDISNSEQNTANTGANLASSNKQVGTTGILKHARLIRDNNGTSAATEERSASTKPKQVRFNLPGDLNSNVENRSQTDTIASTTRYNNQDNQTPVQVPSNINDTTQTNNSLQNLPLPPASSTSSTSSNLSPSITMGRYRNKNFNLSEIFGTAYNPLPIPPTDSLSDSNYAYRVNPYISKNHVQVTIQKDNINLQALNPTLNSPIRFGFSNTGGTMKRNFTNFSSS